VSVSTRDRDGPIQGWTRDVECASEEEGAESEEDGELEEGTEDGSLAYGLWQYGLLVLLLLLDVWGWG
jgi:hypothetical protein